MVWDDTVKNKEDNKMARSKIGRAIDEYDIRSLLGHWRLGRKHKKIGKTMAAVSAYADKVTAHALYDFAPGEGDRKLLRLLLKNWDYLKNKTTTEELESIKKHFKISEAFVARYLSRKAVTEERLKSLPWFVLHPDMSESKTEQRKKEVERMLAKRRLISHKSPRITPKTPRLRR